MLFSPHKKTILFLLGNFFMEIKINLSKKEFIATQASELHTNSTQGDVLVWATFN
jgi:hypothetical protein